MILYMIDSDRGRMRIGRLVNAELGRQGVTAAEVGARGRPRLATIKRIKAGDPNVSETMLRALGDKLGMPRDYLLYVGTGDVRQIEKSGADPDLIRVTLELINSTTPESDRHTTVG